MILSQLLTPTDAAMSVLKVDLGTGLAQSGDKVEKILPLVAAAFALHGAKRGAGLDLGLGYDPRKWSSANFNPTWEDKARREDPITGGLLAGEHGLLASDTQIEDPTAAQRLLGAGIGATQAVNPFSYVRNTGAGIRTLGRGAARQIGKVGTKRGAAKTAARRHAAGQEVAALKPVGPRKPAAIQELYDDAYEVGAAGAKPSWLTRQGDKWAARGQVPDVGRGFGWGPRSRMLGVGGRALQMANPMFETYGFLPTVGPDNPDVPFLTDTSGAYGGGATPYGASGLESANYGDMGVSNVSSFGTPEQQIWQQGGQQEWSGQFGGGAQNQVKTGENMNIGEQMLKEASTRMLEKDDKKKPKGGGIVLVIGHGKGDKKGDDSKKDGPC